MFTEMREMMILIEASPQFLFFSQNPNSTPKPFQNPNFFNLTNNASQSHQFFKFRPITAQFSHQPNTPDAGLLFREKILYLENLNVNTRKVLRENPNIRSAPLSSLKSVEECISSMGIERAAMGRILDMLPQLLTCDPHSDLYPVFDFLLNEVGIPYHDVRKSILRCPRLLVCGVEEQLRPTLCFLRDLGFVGPHSITCQTTLLLVSSVESTLLPKIEYLQGLGFTRDDVASMVLRSPGLLTFSVANNLTPKVEYFLKEMNGDLAELKRFPQFFSFSLEGKIKPRHRMLLELGFSLPLPKMLKVGDDEFSDRLFEMRLR